MFPVKALSHSWRSLCFLVGLFCILSIPGHSQNELGRPLINNYSFRDYNAAPVNWWAVEDHQGIMYFANGQGVLEYDGANWRTITLPGRQSARSMAMDDQGIIYVGSIGDFGYLTTDSKGLTTYQSLLDKVPEEHRSFLDVWEVDYWQDAIYYRTTSKLFRWNGNEFKIITAPGNYHVGAIVHDKYYIRIWDVGLCVMENDTFRVVPGGEEFADERIYVILPYDEKRVLIGVRETGKFYLFDGDGFSPFETEAEKLVKGSLYLPGLALPDGFVLNAFGDGLVIIDREGNLVQALGEDDGLQNNTVTNVFLDSRDVLWLTTFSGISNINLNSPFTFIDESDGLPSNAFDVVQHDGTLYTGSNNGTYYYNHDLKKFQHMQGTFGQSGSFIRHRERLYTGSGGMGVIEIKGNTFEFVRESKNYDFRVSQMIQSALDPDRIYVDMQQGGITSLYYDEKSRKFEEESRVEYPNPDYGAFMEDTNGNIWTKGSTLGSVAVLEPLITNGVLDLEKSKVTEYDARNGLPKADIGFLNIDGNLEFFINSKIYRFNQEEEKFYESQPFYSELYDPNAPSYPRPKKDAFARTWFGLGRGLIISSKSSEGHNELIYDPFREIKNFPVWGINISESSTKENTIAWFTGIDGIIRYEGDLTSPPIPPFKVNVRSFSLGGDSLIAAGVNLMDSDLKLGHQDNTVTLGYASPFYLSEDDIEYQTFLEGLDRRWSTWSEQPMREYINLPSGKYTFKVKARNVYGVESDPAVFTFSINPPWYNTWWAYLLYILAAAAAVYLIVRYRTHSLRQQQKLLEDTVDERTQEVQQRVDELATVNRVSRALTEKLEVGELVELVGDQMKNLFKANISYLALLDPKTNIINFPYQDGDSMAPLKYGEGLTSKIIATGEPLLINRDISKEYNEMGIQQVGKNASSYLGVPIPMEDKYVGVLSVQSTEQENRFTDNDKRLLNTIAQNVGTALHNAELYEEAKAAKAQAEDANEAKSAFLSTVSHELRTPLTSVLGFAKIIRKRLEDKIFPAVQIEDQKIKRSMKQVSENLAVVVSEGERLTTLINDVLDLAKIESGRMEWHLKPVFLQDVISRAVSSTSSLFESKDLSLVKNVPTDLPVVNADQDKLIQVVINLLSNAVKFTDKGQVTVEAYEDAGQIIVEVQDTGVGIAEEDKHKVFERFRQAGDTLTDKPQGTGLGLPICREIIEHHGGIIWMKSEVGVGSTFFFSMPILGDPAAAQPLELDRIVKSLKKQIKHSAIPAANNMQTILVVDDDTPIRSLLRQELSDAGYQVQEASNGKVALDMVRVKKPDLILLDVMMPEINGFDVAAVLKNDPETMDIPIIILSIVQDQERGLRIGVDRYLTKPIDTEKLFVEVDALLEQGVSKKKVLVVDEDASTVKTLSEVLTARGYNVLDANGGDLIETAVKNQPDIIMLNSLYNGDKEIVKTLKFEKGLENVLFFVYQ